MGSFGSPTVSSSATAPKSAPAHSATSPREDYHPSPSPSGGQQLSSDHIHDVFRRQPHGAPKSRIQSKDNNSIKPKPPNSTVDSSAANEDVPRSPSLDQSSPPTLITTFTTEPNDFWWQLLKASSPIHANFPSVVNMDGKWNVRTTGSPMSFHYCGLTYQYSPVVDLWYSRQVGGDLLWCLRSQRASDRRCPRDL